MNKIIVVMRDGVQIESHMSREELDDLRKKFRDTLELASQGKSTPLSPMITLDDTLFIQLQHMQSIIFHTDDEDALTFTVSHKLPND